MVYKKGRIPWNKGLKNPYSEETIKRMSEATRNRIHQPRTLEWKAKIGIKHKGKKNPKARNNPQTYRKGHTPWNKGKVGCFNENILQKIRSARVKQTFLNSNTKIELIMAEALQKANIKYVPQFNLGDICVIDFAIPDKKIAIECDGLYWHSLPRNRRADGFKSRCCKENGWILLRFPESQIKSNISSCIDVIKGVVK